MFGTTLPVSRSSNVRRRPFGEQLQSLPDNDNCIGECGLWFVEPLGQAIRMLTCQPSYQQCDSAHFATKLVRSMIRRPNGDFSFVDDEPATLLRRNHHIDDSKINVCVESSGHERIQEVAHQQKTSQQGSIHPSRKPRLPQPSGPPVSPSFVIPAPPGCVHMNSGHAIIHPNYATYGGGINASASQLVLKVLISNNQWRILTFNLFDDLPKVANQFLQAHDLNGVFLDGLVTQLQRMVSLRNDCESVDIVDLL